VHYFVQNYEWSTGIADADIQWSNQNYFTGYSCKANLLYNHGIQTEALKIGVNKSLDITSNNIYKT
jgi:hypothetical protein